MDFIGELSERGVTERRFDLQVGGATVPGLIWTPEGASGPRPLVLVGHGGTQHKRTDNVLTIARRLVRHHRYAVCAIDAPDHGDRITPEEAERARQSFQPNPRGPLRTPSPERVKRMNERSQQAASEWRAVLDAVEAVPGIERGPVGYWGVSMGTMFGVPFVASEPRVKCAVFGLAGLRPEAEAFAQAAASISVPLLFMFQLHDELMTPESGLALFSAFGSKVKSMHINPGTHVGIPGFERDHYETFYVRYLGRPADAQG